MTTKRPLGDSSSEGDVSPPSASTLSRQPKKIKVDVGDASGLQRPPAKTITDLIHADLRTAINIKKALDGIDKLKPLGYCPSKVQQFRKKFELDKRELKDKKKGPPEGRFRTRDLANQAILDELVPVYKEMKTLASGKFTKYHSFQLCITRPGCEYNDDVNRHSDEIDDLLPAWFENSAISGYGDMQSLETKVDSEVRNAREIPASEFTVERGFLEQIEKLWGTHFIPREVRAVPYKIHLYGPGGHFKSHRDTPETNLVGTFLVGLGDTSTSEGNFHIEDKTLRAERRSWVAFHPDTPHEVTKLEDGYRAVLAFKLFRKANNKPKLSSQACVKKILDQISVPFGLLTTHQYSIGTTSLNGFDALLLAYAESRDDTQAHLLSVVTRFHGKANEIDLDPSTKSLVFPFTRDHVDILLGKNLVHAKKNVRWLDGLTEIPFYTWDTRASLEAWKEDHPENYTGNEAFPSEEDSIYLSYAILLLPRTPDPRDIRQFDDTDSNHSQASDDTEDTECSGNDMFPY